MFVGVQIGCSNFHSSTTLCDMSLGHDSSNNSVGAAVDAGAAVANAGAANVADVLPQAGQVRKHASITPAQEAKKRKKAHVVDKELKRLGQHPPPPPVISPSRVITRDEAAYNNGKLLVNLQVEGWTPQTDKWEAGVVQSTSTRRPVGPHQQAAEPAKHVLVVVDHAATIRAYRVECVRKVNN